MSEEQALRFFSAVRDDSLLRESLVCGEFGSGLDGLVALGAGQGLSFSADELCQAFRYDWCMCYMHMGAARQPQPSRD